MSATDELLEKLRMLKYDYDSMSTSLEDAIDDIAYELEQAIAATLGSGECEWELEHSGTLYDKWRCSECKFLFVEPRCDQGYMDLVPNYCPKCGRRVKGGAR